MRPHLRPKGEFPLGGMARSAKRAAVNPHGRPNGASILPGNDAQRRKEQA